MKIGFLLGALALLLASGCSARQPPRTPGTPPSNIDVGLASWYGLEEAGRATASGEPMAPEKMTAAHKTLPFGSLVRVTDLDTSMQVEVIINDRGPFVDNRIIDLSFGAARNLGIVEKGVAKVRIEVIGLKGPLAARRWRVQVGSFTEQRTARNLATLIQSEGYSPVSVSPFEDRGTRYYRVWVGEYRERDGAETLQRQLQRAGHQGFALLAAATTP